MRLSRTTLAVAAAGVLLTSGCTEGDAEADPEPRIPSSSPTDPSPTESTPPEEPDEAPVMPEAAMERSGEGVESFLGHWAETVTYSLNSGDTVPLAELSLDQCMSCNGSIDLIDDVYSKGGSISNRGWSVRQVVFGPFLSRPLAKFDRKLEVVRRPSKPAERYPAAVSTIEFELVWRDDSWWIAQFTPKA